MSLTSLENNFCLCGKVGLKVRCFGAEHCERCVTYLARRSTHSVAGAEHRLQAGESLHVVLMDDSPANLM